MVIGTVYFGLWSVSPYCGWTFTMLFWGSHCVFCSREDAPAAFLPSVPLRTPLRQGLPLSTASKYTCGSAAINGIFANRHSGSSAGSPSLAPSFHWCSSASPCRMPLSATDEASSHLLYFTQFSLHTFILDWVITLRNWDAPFLRTWRANAPKERVNICIVCVCLSKERHRNLVLGASSSDTQAFVELWLLESSFSSLSTHKFAPNVNKA